MRQLGGSLHRLSGFRDEGLGSPRKTFWKTSPSHHIRLMRRPKLTWCRLLCNAHALRGSRREHSRQQARGAGRQLPASAQDTAGTGQPRREQSQHGNTFPKHKGEAGLPLPALKLGSPSGDIHERYGSI